SIRMHKWSIEENLVEVRAASKRRLRAELGQYQLLDRVVEHPPARLDARFSIVSKQCPEKAPFCIRTIGQSNSRGERMGVTRGHAFRYTRVARNHQSGWSRACVRASRTYNPEVLKVSDARRA